MVEYLATNASNRSGWLRSLGMPFDGVREKKASRRVCASLRYRNWVRKNDAGFGNVRPASGTTRASNDDSEHVGRGADDASTGRRNRKGRLVDRVHHDMPWTRRGRR